MADLDGIAIVDGDFTKTITLLVKLATSIPLSYYIIGFLLFVTVLLYNFLEFHLVSDLLRGYRGDKVHLTFNNASELYHGVVSKCRILHGRYLTTPWLSNPHFQTAFLNFFGNPPSFRYRRQIFHVPDGGTVALDWFLHSDVVGSSSSTYHPISEEDTTPIIILVPGLTSDSASPYVKHLVYKMANHGWNVVVSNHRGLGGISITSDCFYNAGWTEDVRVVINYLHQELPNASLYAVGTSIGANVLVKYLGEEGENTPIAGAASVCSPWDLVVCDRFIARKLVQRFYDRALAIGLKGYAQLHQPVLSRIANWEGIKRSRSVRDFDNYATCLVAKYETVDTYYRHCSSASFVGNVSVPLLCISALDDPVCTKEAIPWDECRANKNIVLATTAHGGHLAFFQGLAAKNLWWVGAVEEFLRVLHASPYTHRQKNVPSSSGPHCSLESGIDRAPYVNVTEDGLLTAVGDDGITIDNPDEISNREVTSLQEADNLENETNHQMQVGDPVKDEQAHERPQPDSSSKSYIEKNVHELVAPVKKALNQLSRHTSKSFWLLVYIAIVTTYPFIGSFLHIVLKKKLKNFFSAARHGR